MEVLKTLGEFKLITALLSILVIILFIVNGYAGLFGLLIASFILFELVKDREKNKQEEVFRIQNLCEDFDSAAQDSIFNMPFPLIMTDEHGIISWYNPAFLKIINAPDAVGDFVDDAVPGFKFLQNKEEVNKRTEIALGNSNYILFVNKVHKANNRNIYLFYFVDNSEYNQLKKRFSDNRLVFGHVYIDNYDEIGHGNQNVYKTMIVADIDNKVIEYFNTFDAIVRKYENGKYFLVMNRDSLDKMIKDKFSILDKIRESNKERTPITLSIGLSNSKDTIYDSYQESRSAVDLALGRGGDQVVVVNGDKHLFFGGRTAAKEKRNKVRARIIGLSLANLIEQAEDVFIMGHRIPDMDAIGSSIGMLSAVRDRDKTGYIVLNSSNPSIDVIMEEMENVQPELLESIITSSEAIELAKKTKSLIIMLDNHKPSFAEEPKLFDMIEKVVVIDHHRRGMDCIETAVLTYIEPYASSTSELVTEILTYINPDINITKFEAEALMAGIMVDTKGFSFQTGVRTFEAAALLKRYGADMMDVKRFFKDDIETVKVKAKVVQTSRIIMDKIAVGTLDEQMESGILIAAQAADELLNIDGVQASFVLTDAGNYIHISGRSLGEISVQLILEGLGGGGHLVAAGTQLHGVTMSKAQEMLVAEIEKYFDENKESINENNFVEG